MPRLRPIRSRAAENHAYVFGMWTHIASAPTGSDRLELYKCDSAFMIRVNGWELMNGTWHGSEDQLGRLAGQLAGVPHPHILVGGLGLGYTLASLLDALGDRIGPGRGSVTVAERSNAVLGWFNTHINPRLAATLPAGSRLLASDIAACVDGRQRWHVIVLDVDNGPEAVSCAENSALYDESGLALFRASLAPSGHLLLWSGFEDPGFAGRAEAAGFSVTLQHVPFPGRGEASHVLYVLSREPVGPAECDRLKLSPSCSSRRF